MKKNIIHFEKIKKQLFEDYNVSFNKKDSEYNFVSGEGFNQPIKFDDKGWYIPTVNISKVHKKPYLYWKMLSDFERFDFIDEWKPNVSYKVLNLSDLKLIANNIKDKLLACDIETTGLNFKKDKITAIGFQGKKGKTNIIPEKLIKNKYTKKLLENNNLIFHNGKFDIKFLNYNLNSNIEVSEDTMLLNYSKWNNNIPNNLKFLASKYFMDYDYSIENYNTLFKEELYKYLAKDCEYTLRIYKILKENSTFAYKNIMIPLSNVLAEVELQGMKLDITYLKQVEKKYNTKINNLENKLIKLAKEFGFSKRKYLTKTDSKTCSINFNPSSDSQVEFVIYDLMQLKSYTNKDKTGKNSINIWLSKLSESKEKTFIKLLKQYKKYSKLYSTFIKNYINKETIHTQYKIAGTRSGRLTSKNPNLQQIPRNKEIKNIFISRKGFDLVEVDYSQAELRTLGILSKDKFLQKVYTNDRDLHSEVAKKLFGKNFTKEDRNKAKTLNFGIPYGINYTSLCQNFNLSKKRAKKIYYEWFEKLDGAGKYIEEKRKLTETPTTIFERERKIGIITKDNKNAVKNWSVNHYIQSTASDLTLLSLIKIYNEIVKNNKEIYIVNTVHDSIIFEIKEGKVDYYVSKIKSIMEEIPKKHLGDFIPFKVDIETGKSWGGLK